MRRFLGTMTTSKAPFLTLALTRARSRRFELRARPCLKHNARDHFNADRFNAAEPARPQIVVQTSGLILVGHGDREQLARTLLQEINRLTEVATVAFATFHATLHLQQLSLQAQNK